MQEKAVALYAVIYAEQNAFAFSYNNISKGNALIALLPIVK